MENLDYARLQMAFTLDFHIIFACTGYGYAFFYGYITWQMAEILQYDKSPEKGRRQW